MSAEIQVEKGSELRASSTSGFNFFNPYLTDPLKSTSHLLEYLIAYESTRCTAKVFVVENIRCGTDSYGCVGEATE